MSVDYAAGLSYCDDLGDCGLDEVFDKIEDVRVKVKLLANWLRHHKGSCIVHAGAGLSTSAGIRDFRGKEGVWTEFLKGQNKGSESQKKGSLANSTVIDKVINVANDDEKLGKLKLETNQENSSSLDATCERRQFGRKPFDETIPTTSHLTLKALCELGYVSHIVSQNVDGLFLKSNLKRKYISELHGNFYLDECTRCRSRFIRGTCSQTMCLKKSSIKCPKGMDGSATFKPCNGYLRDTILDWDSPIPYNELRVAMRESKRSRLHICIGTSLQLKPSKDLVCKPKESSTCKLVLINLQPTKFDKNANLVINYYADDVMTQLANELEINIPSYDSSQDPTKDLNLIGTLWRK